MKKKWTPYEQYKNGFVGRLIILPLAALVFVILGIVFCVNIPEIWWVGVILISFGIILVGITSVIMIVYIKIKKDEEDE